MADHTPGPISRDPENWMSVIDGTSHWTRRLICQFNGKDRTEAEANAERMVACWNACAGIPTEQLRAGLLEDLEKHFGELLSARDTQLAHRQQHRNPDIAEWVWENARAALAPFREG